MRRFPILLYWIMPMAIAAAGFWFWKKPTNAGEWAPEAVVLPQVQFEANKVRILNIRNSIYGPNEEFTPGYYYKDFNLEKLSSLWFFVVPFYKNWAGPAHTLLSFGFQDGSYLAISPEIRRRKGQSYSAIKGMMRSFEIMYVVADERDVIRLRAEIRKDDVYLYPIQVSRERIKDLFVDMLRRVNQLRTQPEFYNTFTNSCASNIVRHVNTLYPGKIPFSYRTVLPGYSDRLAYDLRLLDNSVSFEELREKHKINERAKRYAQDLNFSKMIRMGL